MVRSGIAILAAALAALFSGFGGAASASHLGSAEHLAPGGLASSTADRALQARIESYLVDRSGKYGVVVRNLRDGRTVLLNADEEFPAASLYKLVVMYRVFEEVEAGSLSMDDTITITSGDTAESYDSDLGSGEKVTVEKALRAMIAVSSNTAAHALARVSGGWQRVKDAAGELSITLGERDGAFTTTPASMAQFFDLLSAGGLVSNAASEQMLRILLQQEVNDRIPALLPPEAQVAHKTGELDEVRNDAGIVTGPNGGFVIVVMSKEASPDEALNLASYISLVSYAEYADHPPRLAQARPLPRDQVE